MKTTKKIKVIRKKDLKEVERPERSREAAIDETGKKSARRIVSNVSSWVNELQKRKRAETQEAIEKIFPGNPQADSA